MNKDINAIKNDFYHWNLLRNEQDGRPMIKADGLSEEELLKGIANFKSSEVFDENEPSDWQNIKKLSNFNYQVKKPQNYLSKLKGALLGRFAGCTLGVPVENYPIFKMESIAKESNTPFPPTDYWNAVENPEGIQYGVNKRIDYSKGNIKGVPVDDDITYTVLSMLLMKKYGFNYTVEDVAELWKEIVPYACTAEEEALKELNLGSSGEDAAKNNPFIEWIGGAIRADSFGYVCAGNPAKAVELNYPEIYLTHRRNGIYGGLFVSASIACSFVEDSPYEAIKKGAEFIPHGSRLYKDLQWALSFKDKLKDYKHARSLLDERFSQMHCVHTNNNMCAVVFAIILGNGDFTSSISQSIAIGLDNDCNGATVGSIVGANVGLENIEKHWYEPFGDVVMTYLKGYEKLSIQELVEDYVKLNEKLCCKD